MMLDRIAMFRIAERPAGMYTMTMTDEWLSENTPPLMGNPAVTEVDCSRIGLTTGLSEVSMGIPVILQIKDFAAKEQDFFKQYNFSSIAVLPIMVKDSLYRLLLFIDRSERIWSEEEIEAMKISANIIGSAIGLTKTTT
jgi:hypothetical protein